MLEIHGPYRQQGESLPGEEFVRGYVLAWGAAFITGGAMLAGAILLARSLFRIVP